MVLVLRSLIHLIGNLIEQATNGATKITKVEGGGLRHIGVGGTSSSPI